MPDTLAQRIKAKYPGQYDDLSDTDLEAKITAKFPGIYDDLPRTQAANFSATNEKDATGNAVVDGPLDAIKGAWSTSIGGVPAMARTVGEAAQAGLKVFGGAMSGNVQAVTDGAQALRRMGADILGAQTKIKHEADAAWDKGDHVTALRKYADWLVPVIGPQLDQSADKAQQGQVWRAAGEAVGLAATLAGPEALKNARVKVPALAKNANPVEAAALRFADERGVPVDAATATGNPFVRNIQKGVGNTPLGSIPAMRGKAAQSTALERVGRDIANEVHPVAQTPELAGEQLRGSLEGLVGDLHQQANAAYSTLRDIEADPANAVDVRVSDPRHAAINANARGSVGRPVTDTEWSELRRIREELDAMPYQQGGTVKNANASSGTENDWTYGDMRQSSRVQARGGAPVYNDILQAAPGTSKLTRAEVLASIDRALQTGTFTNAARGALDVVRDRMAGDARASSPTLPPGAGDVLRTESMQMPVDLSAVKKMLRPVYDQMARQLPITQQRSSPGLKAIQNIIDGPDYAPVSQVDQDLSTIKSLSRGADLPELRNLSQGLAAQAIKRLETEVSKTMSRAASRGDEAASALTEGRGATRAKFDVAGELKALREEPVQAFKQTVYANDAGIARLRRLSEYAPMQMSQLGRAWLDDALAMATSDGGFDRTAKLSANWKNLGPQTRKILFADPGQVAALDNYFKLAEMMNRNPNPSGSGLMIGSMASGASLVANPIAGLVGNLAAGGLSAILQSPKAVRLLTKGTTLILGPGRASTAARTLGIADVLAAMREAGAQRLGAPAPGTADPTTPQGQLPQGGPTP